MILVIQLFGMLMVLAGVTILIDPQIIFGPLHRRRDSIGLQLLAVAGRVVLGGLLVAYAGQSRLPALLIVLGIITLVAGLVLALMDAGIFGRMMSWALGLARTFGRVAGLFVAVFGVFLIYVYF